MILTNNNNDFLNPLRELDKWYFLLLLFIYCQKEIYITLRDAVDLLQQKLESKIARF